MDEAVTEQNKILQRVYPINNLTVKKFELLQDKGAQPVTTENLSLSAPEYASVDNDKLYFAVNSVNRHDDIPKEVRNRSNDVYINDGFTDEDLITYKIPAGYKFLKAPLNVSIEKPFGKFKANLSFINGQLVYSRKLQVVDGTYSKDLYQDLVDFYRDVEEADHYTVSMVKN